MSDWTATRPIIHGSRRPGVRGTLASGPHLVVPTPNLLHEERSGARLVDSQISSGALFEPNGKSGCLGAELQPELGQQVAS